MNNFNGIISVVTGGGKTIFGIFCISYLFENNLIDSVIVIVPTKTLQDQWAANFISSSDIKIDEISFNNKRLKKVNILKLNTANVLNIINIYFNMAKS